jgi:hypothetical protein
MMGILTVQLVMDDETLEKMLLSDDAKQYYGIAMWHGTIQKSSDF